MYVLFAYCVGVVQAGSAVQCSSERAGLLGREGRSAPRLTPRTREPLALGPLWGGEGKGASGLGPLWGGGGMGAALRVGLGAFSLC